MIHSRTLQALEFQKIIEYLAAQCCSDMGRSLALAVSPLPSRSDAEEAFALFEEFCVWQADPVANPGGFHLSSFPDVEGLLNTVAEKAGSGGHPQIFDLEAFWALRETLRMAQKAVASIAGNGASNWPLLLDLAQTAPMPEQLLAALNRCISDDGLIKDESSPELYRLRGELRKLHQSCLRKVKDYAKQYNMLALLQDDFMTLSSDRYVLPLKANFKGRMQGIIHDWSQTGETCYFEPMFLVEINNRLQELKHEERQEEHKILEYLGSLLLQELSGARNAVALLAALDLLRAKHAVASVLDAACPTFTADAEGIALLGARHPLLSLDRLKKGPDSDPVRPLDIILRPGERALIITGGNAGGKTVCLKTLGLVAAMAMSGLPAPVAKGSHLPWFNRMDAFIGDEQSLADNVSTFTAQIDHLAKAWKHLDNQGLVLLDEFGAGTDPAEGAALSQAVLDELLARQCFVLSATHFPALKSYALTKEGVRAASMLFNPKTNRPLFQLAYDQVGSSQALIVAAEHGLPESILARARHYLLQDGEDSSALLKRLNELAAQREQELQELEHERKRAKNILAEQKEKLARERTRLAREVADKISQLMRAWKEDKATARQTMREMSALKGNLNLSVNDAEESVLPPVKNFLPGQTVLHALFNKSGKIMELDERRHRARLDMNGVSLWAELKDLRQPVTPVQQSPRPAIKMTSEPLGSMSLDVRGMRAAEALNQVESFLDRAILAGFSEVEIIHGRGTGALRREIHSFLRGFPAVSEIALAPEDRGGDGMTIVNLG